MFVGIDGSKHAVHAAIWAIDEAVRRGSPLRLVHVIEGPRQSQDRGYAHAGDVLHKACRAIESIGRPVVVDSDVFEGDPVRELVEASRGAALICLGSQGTNDSAGRRRGWTATEIARRAYCPVMIVEKHHRKYRMVRGPRPLRHGTSGPFRSPSTGETVDPWSI